MPPVRFGLIGYGAWGSHHAQAIALHPRAQLCAIAARTPATLDRAKTDFPTANGYTDYRQMLQREKLDAVVIVLPTDLHLEAASAVLESGCHLLLEKPMALTAAQCDAVNQLAIKHKRVLAIGHEFRLSSLWGKAKQMIDDGAIGAPLYAPRGRWLALRYPARRQLDPRRADPFF
jgi:myo-inositol 2-dehydrogenase/D-chiro-inositol 1-dehydrogenase